MELSYAAETSEHDFDKAFMRARFQGLFNALTWKNTNLLSLYEVTGIIKPKKETYLGMRTIRVDMIVGSENRYHDFSSAFYPKRMFLKDRWKSVDRARLTDVILPPISVYSLGGYYFVRDGNHRVSVAKSTGAEFIDAEVVELDSEIELKPGMTARAIRQCVVNYERNRFLAQYKPDYLPMGVISFTSPGAYPEMVNHILVHKYYINMSRKDEIPFKDAAISWYGNVYKPIVKEIREQNLLFNYPGHTEGDLYMWLVRRWDELKRKEKNASIEEAGKVMKKESERGTIQRYIEAAGEALLQR